MTATDELLENNAAYASSFDKSELKRPESSPEWAAEAFPDLDADVKQSIARIKASPFIPRKDSVRGFVYEVETGRLREVS